MERMNRLVLSVTILALMVTGCGKKQEQQWGRVPGDASPEAPQPSADQASAHRLMKPTDGASSAPMMQGDIPAPPKTDVVMEGNILKASGIAFSVPQGWEKETPSSSFRLAQFKMPGSAGAGDVGVFAFGSGQGGTTDDNVRRWVNQFTPDDKTTTGIPSDVARMEQDGLQLALVKTSGTYQPGMMTPQEPKPGYALFGIVIEGGAEGSVFVKATGPKATMDEQNKNLEALAQSIRKAK
jgi:hypothetical protein